MHFTFNSKIILYVDHMLFTAFSIKATQALTKLEIYEIYLQGRLISPPNRVGFRRKGEIH